MPAIVQEIVRLTGELTAFRAAGSDGWGFGRLDTGGERIAITGKLVGVRLGDTVEVAGSWAEHPKYGRQLRVHSCTPHQAESASGIIAWLTSTLPDIGRARATAMVERFGAELWSVIELDSARLREIPGLTAERITALCAAYHEHRANRDHMITLRGWGLTDGQIARCVTTWKTLAGVVAQITSNPYRLSQAVYGFGFARADKVAMLAGVPYDSPHRVDAVLEHVLDQAVGAEGHVYLPQGELRTRAHKLTGVPEEQVQQGIDRALRAGDLVRRGVRIYLPRLELAERGWAEFVETMQA